MIALGSFLLLKFGLRLHCRFILLTLFIIIGLIGNTVCIIILRRPAFSHSSTIPFLLFLAVFDNIEVVSGESQNLLRTRGQLRDSHAIRYELYLGNRFSRNEIKISF